MEILVPILLVPLCWPFIAKSMWGQVYSWPELALNLVLACVLGAGIWHVGRYAQMRDVEILNGAVTGKTRERVSCDHSYSCNCTANSKGETSCSTCYEHSNDYDWMLQTTVDSIKIRRVDSQGTSEPPRYLSAKIGDPVAVEHSFANYVKAAPNSLFHDKGTVTTVLPLPVYPNSVYDYHHVNRVLTVGVVVPDLALWNQELSLSLRDIGPAKQANFIVVFAKTDRPDYAQALEQAWLGGKKNDVIVVLGTPDYPEISWVRVLSWTDKQDFKVVLRDRILDLKTVEREKIITALHDETQKTFVRKPMKDFEYLKNEIDSPMWVSILAFLLSSGFSVGLSIYFRKS